MFRRRRWKAVLLLAAMYAALTISAAAASPAHHHSDAIGSDCELCCVGHLPALQSPHLFDLRPVVQSDWQAAVEECQSSLDPQFTATPGRAPPRQ
jgi:hypothetical protein